MIVANDLKLKVYLRSMAAVIGLDEVKRIAIECMLELETEMETFPELNQPKKFDLNPIEIKRCNGLKITYK